MTEASTNRQYPLPETIEFIGRKRTARWTPN